MRRIDKIMEPYKKDRKDIQVNNNITNSSNVITNFNLAESIQNAEIIFADETGKCSNKDNFIINSSTFSILLF